MNDDDDDDGDGAKEEEWIVSLASEVNIETDLLPVRKFWTGVVSLSSYIHLDLIDIVTGSRYLRLSLLFKSRKHCSIATNVVAEQIYPW
jgi:hypothetical protein